MTPSRSIYRFRRADVAQMWELQQRMKQSGGSTVSLVQNFRSQEGIIRWVNQLFGDWMKDSGDGGGGAGYVQAHYEDMFAVGKPYVRADANPGVGARQPTVRRRAWAWTKFAVRKRRTSPTCCVK